MLIIHFAFGARLDLVTQLRDIYFIFHGLSFLSLISDSKVLIGSEILFSLKLWCWVGDYVMVEFRFSSRDLATPFPHLATTSRGLPSFNYIASIVPAKNRLRRVSWDLCQTVRCSWLALATIALLERKSLGPLHIYKLNRHAFKATLILLEKAFHCENKQGSFWNRLQDF